MGKNDAQCSFCGAERNNVNMLIAGTSGHICDSCALQAVNIVNEEQKVKGRININTSAKHKILKPIEIKNRLAA